MRWHCGSNATLVLAVVEGERSLFGGTASATGTLIGLLTGLPGQLVQAMIATGVSGCFPLRWALVEMPGWAGLHKVLLGEELLRTHLIGRDRSSSRLENHQSCHSSHCQPRADPIDPTRYRGASACFVICSALLVCNHEVPLVRHVACPKERMTGKLFFFQIPKSPPLTCRSCRWWSIAVDIHLDPVMMAPWHIDLKITCCPPRA